MLIWGFLPSCSPDYLNNSFNCYLHRFRASQVELMVKNSPVHAEDLRDMGSIPGLGRSLGGGQGNPLQYLCLENPIDRGVWWATAHRVAKSQSHLKRLRTCTLWQKTSLSFHTIFRESYSNQKICSQLNIDYQLQI